MPWDRPNAGKPYTVDQQQSRDLWDKIVEAHNRRFGVAHTDMDEIRHEYAQRRIDAFGDKVGSDIISLHRYLTALENTMAAVAEKAGIGRQEFNQMLRDAVAAEEARDNPARVRR